MSHALGGRGQRGATAGLIVGQRWVSPAAIARVHFQIEGHGLLGATGTAFAESLTVNAAGDCAAACELLGPFNVLCCGDASGLFALVHAAGALRRDASVRRMVAAAVDECDDRTPGATPFEGAAAVALGDAGSWVLRGEGVAGPGMTEVALAAALARAGLARGSLVGEVHVGDVGDGGDARPGVVCVPRLAGSGGLLALMHGLERFAGPFAVVQGEPRAASCAVIVAPVEASSG